LCTATFCCVGVRRCATLELLSLEVFTVPAFNLREVSQLLFDLASSG
jgi:hypothetical protein